MWIVGSSYSKIDDAHMPYHMSAEIWVDSVKTILLCAPKGTSQMSAEEGKDRGGGI